MRLFMFSAGEILQALPELREEDLRCASCNQNAPRFFWIADSRFQALEDIRMLARYGSFAFCGECMAEVISKHGFEIETR